MYIFKFGIATTMFIHTIDSIQVCNDYHVGDINQARLTSDATTMLDGKYSHLYAWDNCEKSLSNLG